MKILIADDDAIYRQMISASVAKWGHETELAEDGAQALRIMVGSAAPPLTLLDWLMPGLDGLTICKTLREIPGRQGLYVILVTSQDSKANLAEGLDAGANDYITKPFDLVELRARVAVGVRTVELQTQLAQRLNECERSREEIQRLRGILPICCYCKKIRSDGNYWQQVENYISERSEVRFSHGHCPECFEKFVKPDLDAAKAKAAANRQVS